MGYSYDNINKMPLGFPPRKFHEQERMLDLKDAIERRASSEYIWVIPIEWVEEYNELASKYKGNIIVKGEE